MNNVLAPVRLLARRRGIWLSTRVFLLLLVLVLLFLQAQPLVFFEAVEPSIASVSVGRSPERTPNTLYVQLSGGETAKGYNSGLTPEQVISVRSYDRERELHWDYERPPRGRRRPVGGITGVVASAAVVALLAVVFLLLSCGISISRTAKTTQTWDGGRQLASSEDEGVCTKIATEAGETLASDGGAGKVADGGGGITAAGDAAVGEAAAVDSTAVVSSLNPAAPPFFPRGSDYAGQVAVEGDTAAGGDPGELAVSSSKLNVFQAGPERAPEEVATAGEAAEQEAIRASGVAPSGEQGQRRRVPLLWPTGVKKAIPRPPFFDLYVTRLCEFAAYCRDYLGELPLHHVLTVAQHVVRYAVVEIAALTPYCTGDQEGQRQSVIQSFFHLAWWLGGCPRAQQEAVTPLDSLINALTLLREKRSFPVARARSRAHTAEQILRPAGAALRHMAAAVNTLLQSLQGDPPVVPPAVFAAQAAVMNAVTEQRLLQALSENAAAQALQQLQSNVTPGIILREADTRFAKQKYSAGYGWKKAECVNRAARRARAAAVAAAGAEDATVPQQLVGPELGQQLPEHQISHGQQQQEHALQEHQPRQQQSPVAPLESPQEGTSAATQTPMVEAAEGLDTEASDAKARRQAHQQQLQEQAWQGSVRLWQQAGPSPQQQQQHRWRSSPLLQPEKPPGEPWRPYIQEQQPGGAWEFKVFLPPQEQHPSMYVSGFDEAQAGPSRASVGPSGTAADATSLLSPRKSSSLLDSHEQGEDKGSDSEDDAETMELFRGWSSTAHGLYNAVTSTGGGSRRRCAPARAATAATAKFC
ncbi:uncharacterized protein EMH_0084640 [Eimeria mitis]|uniref:Uncharacterized protein n=1 Tax=Eimeria mitis TaxID=44415 RepID=U6KEH6_9EIME|nr:uncharacterized protein EMH_0084640 [Eimeria mitis]CDJ36420.1 hypothetical protein, conserved [Eimeria mitis]